MSPPSMNDSEAPCYSRLASKSTWGEVTWILVPWSRKANLVMDTAEICVGLEVTNCSGVPMLQKSETISMDQLRLFNQLEA